MSKIVAAIGVVVVVTAGATVYVQNQANRVLRQEIAGLRDDVREALNGARNPVTKAARSQSAPTTTTSTVAGASIAAEELTKLREEIAGLKKTTQEIAKFTQLAQAAAAAKSLQNGDSSVAVNLTPVSALKNVGKATPEAATETVLWAAAGGDVETLSRSLTFTPTAREKADAWFAGLSENTRQQYGTPEKVLALMIAKDAASLSGMQVIGQKEVSADNVGVRVRFANNEGKSKENTFLMNRGGDGWRLVLPDDAVEKFAGQLRGGK